MKTDDDEYLFENTRLPIAAHRDKHGESTEELDNFVRELIALYKKYFNKGLRHYELGETLCEFAIVSTWNFTSFNSVESFARTMRSRGDSICKTVAQHWPPPDYKKWPYTAVSHLVV